MKDYIGVYDPEAGSLQLMEVHKVVVRSTLRRETQEMQKQREEARTMVRSYKLKFP